MTKTLSENKVVRDERDKVPTGEIEFENEATSTGEVLRLESDFVLEDKDIEMIQEIAEEKGITFLTTLDAVLRDALDLYHWQRNKRV